METTERIIRDAEGRVRALVTMTDEAVGVLFRHHECHEPAVSVDVTFLPAYVVEGESMEAITIERIDTETGDRLEIAIIDGEPAYIRHKGKQIDLMELKNLPEFMLRSTLDIGNG